MVLTLGINRDPFENLFEANQKSLSIVSIGLLFTLKSQIGL